jgi:biopolymer transport protein ExbB
MNPIGDAFVAIRSFFEAGGDVLWAILFVTTLMWTFIIERVWFFRTELPKRIDAIAKEWDARPDTTSWFARRIRDEMVSSVSVDSHRYLLFIKTLMAVLPLLGLLGTVTGMIQVFDVMAMTGTGNARLMAGGVSAATIPTMSGLVAALSGLYFATYLEQKANGEVERTEDLLVRH